MKQHMAAHIGKRNARHDNKTADHVSLSPRLDDETSGVRRLGDVEHAFDELHFAFIHRRHRRDDCLGFAHAMTGLRCRESPLLYAAEWCAADSTLHRRRGSDRMGEID